MPRQVRKIRNNKELYSCSECSMTFKTEFRLKMHRRMHGAFESFDLKTQSTIASFDESCSLEMSEDHIRFETIKVEHNSDGCPDVCAVKFSDSIEKDHDSQCEEFKQNFHLEDGSKRDTSVKPLQLQCV